MSESMKTVGVGRTVGYLFLLVVAMTLGDVLAMVALPAGTDTSIRTLVSILVAWPPVLVLVAKRADGWAPGTVFKAKRARAATLTGALLAGMGLSLTILVLVSHLPGPSPDSAVQFNESLAEGSRIPLWIAMLLVAPLVEELFFRGWMLPVWERRFGRWGAILGTALLFALLHILWWRILITLPLGVLFGWVFVRTRSVLAAVAAHAGANAAPMVADGLLQAAGYSPVQVEAMASLPWWTAVSAGGAFLLGVRSLLRPSDDSLPR